MLLFRGLTKTEMKWKGIKAKRCVSSVNLKKASEKTTHCYGLHPESKRREGKGNECGQDHQKNQIQLIQDGSVKNYKR